MKFTLEENEGFGAVYALDGPTEVGKVTYAYLDKDRINITHTWVDPKNRGQQIAKKLVDHVVDFARKNNLTLSTTCSYAAALFRSNENYQDVLK